MVSQLAGRLFHPHFAGTGRATSKMDATGFQFHHKQQVISNQSTLGPDFHSRKINRGQYIPMSFEKRRPRPCTFASWSWFNSVRLENILNGCVRDLVADFGQFALNPVDIPKMGFPWRTAESNQRSLVGFSAVPVSSRFDQSNPISWRPMFDANAGSYPV